MKAVPAFAKVRTVSFFLGRSVMSRFNDQNCAYDCLDVHGFLILNQRSIGRLCIVLPKRSFYADADLSSTTFWYPEIYCSNGAYSIVNLDGVPSAWRAMKNWKTLPVANIEAAPDAPPTTTARNSGPPDCITMIPVNPKNIMNAITPWNVSALNDASAPIASMSMPKIPSATSPIPPSTTTRTNQSRNRTPRSMRRCQTSVPNQLHRVVRR